MAPGRGVASPVPRASKPVTTQVPSGRAAAVDTSGDVVAATLAVATAWPGGDASGPGGACGLADGVWAAVPPAAAMRNTVITTEAVRRQALDAPDMAFDDVTRAGRPPTPRYVAERLRDGVGRVSWAHGAVVLEARPCRCA